MGKRVVLGGIFAVVTACGGQADSGGAAGVVAGPADREQGIYQPPRVAGPDLVADGVGTPSAIAMTDERVLVTTTRTRVSGALVDAGALFVVDKRVGSPRMVLLDTRGASFDALASDGKTAFVATSDARLVAVGVSGFETTSLATLDAPAVTVVTAGEYVYVASAQGVVSRVSKKGGAVDVVANVAGPIRGLAVDDAAAYVATATTPDAPAAIVRTPFDGSEPKVLTKGSEPCAMIRDGRSLFWTSLSAADATDAAGAAKTSPKGEVRRLSLEGGVAATVATGAFSACAIAADQNNLYFATSVDSALPTRAGGAEGVPAALGLMRAPMSGGQPVMVAQASRALAQPGAVAVDATHVYWLTDAAVLRIAKP